MGRYAVVDKSGNVTNVIVWDGKTAYTPPEGTELIEVEGVAGPGWTYKDGEFIAPVEETEDEEEVEEVQE
ncbi:MAG: hypothetical protein WD061_00380 [Candidatus Saccharimonadales bacterium]